jgi:D-alanyl-D-alanine carboxypeptidase/D-alanyl-D-alanine-endopeptidase (penicillin-binding protein 4)
MKLLAYLAFLGILATACTSSRINQAFKLGHLDEQASGILIQELGSGKVVFQHDADHYFMPASNAKLVTFLEANRILKDSIPAYRYLETADTLYFWGTGDPSLLHPDLHGDALLKKLSATNKVLVLADSDENVRPLGSGWAWDDYSDDYSAEISSIPMYNNQVRITQKAGVRNVSPAYFTSQVTNAKGLYSKRAYHANLFEVPNIKNDFLQVIPFITSAKQAAEMLSYEINKSILHQPMPFDGRSRLAYAGKLDSLFVPMLHSSDNQIAEQLLYLIAAQKNWVGPTNKIIENLKKEDSLLLPLKWVDGSGLSRYNLMRPKDLVQVLRLLKEEIGEDRLFKLLPESGSTGTIRRMVLDDKHSRFYAKSGSFGNTYNLAGYYRNAKGKWYVFSIMSNLGNQSIVNMRMNILGILNALR